MVVKSLKSFLQLFSKNCVVFLYLYWSPVSVLFTCICINFWYRYRFLVLWYSIVISTMLVTWYIITWYVDHLIPDMLLLNTCPLLWYHLSL